MKGRKGGFEERDQQREAVAAFGLVTRRVH